MPRRPKNGPPQKPSRKRMPASSRVQRPPAKRSNTRRPVNKHRVSYEEIRAGSSGVRSRRNRGAGFSAHLVAGLFFVFVLVYMGRAAYGFFTPGISTEVVRLGTMDIQRTVTGIIIRDEEVFFADRAGHVYFDVGDFERVRGGVLVASIQDTAAMGNVTEEMTAAEDLIMSLQDMRHSTVVAPQVDRLNNNLRNLVNNNIHNFTTGNLTELHGLYESLSDVSMRRNNLIISENRNVRSEWGRALDQSEMHRRMHSSNIYATRTGVMSPIIDGAEERFTIDNMRELSREDLRATIDHSALVPSREVEEGDAVFKIVGNVWYVVAPFPTDMVQGWAQGQDRTVFVQNAVTGEYEPLVMRVESVNYGARETIIILRSTRNVISYLSQRNISIRTSDNISRGLKIEASAVATRSFYRIPRTHVHGSMDNYYVQHRTDYGLRSVPIEISDRTATHVDVMIETLDLFLGDVLAPVDLMGLYHILHESDIRNIHGVYRANMGYANFRVIHLDTELPENGGHILLDPGRNPEIREFDTIVTDASSVTHGQVVR